MRNFLKQVLATLIGSFTGLVLFSAIGTGSLVLLFFLIGSRDQQPQISSNSILVFDLSKPIQDTNPPLSFAEKFLEEEARPLTLQTVVNSIEKAKTDDRINGIYLDGSDGTSNNGYAVLKEIREALVEFQESGKKIIAYDVDWSEREYYLGSVADNVVLNPLGNLEMNGFRSEQTFFAGALDQYGIGIQVVRVGQYKSAVEPFTRQSFSEANEQQMTALLDDLWAEYLNGVGKGRDLENRRLQQIADNEGFLLANEAKELGLVDQLAYDDQVQEQLKKIAGNSEQDPSDRNVSLFRYRNVNQGNGNEQVSENKIAVLYAQGNIVGGEGALDNVGSERFSEEIRKLRKDENVKAVVLRINSPGGSATASDVILRGLQLTREKKPVIVSMGNVAASGGYWIALGGSRIFAQPNTVTGSIGVFGVLPNIQELANNNGITWDEVATGDLAGLNTISRPKTEQELAIYEDAVNRIYDQFLAKVSKSRDLSQQQVAEIAQGRVWSGKQAQEIGLVDELGGLESAIAHAAEAAELGNNWELQEYPKFNPFEDRFLRQLIGETRLSRNSDNPVDNRVQKLRTAWDNFKVLNDPNQAYARLPFEFWIE